MGVLGAVAKHLDALLGPGIMLVFPLYASLRAIESPSTLDDQQWLTYWIIYSFISLFELSSWRVLVWLPFWPYMKLMFCMWLVLPIFNGAAYIYENLVRKYVMIGGSVNGNYPEDRKKILQMMSLDARKAVMQFVDKNGWAAVDRAINAAEKEVRKT
ncbi:unnamed protein product [Dovyalis caffra]|uniref:HVA22-like protein n=1 Tax=Dovyalis caffra TaxID=77055 RepID=A0AAV1RR16_9ROSI|nr:unnamed protein product [Dovyalis caffra]